MQIPHPPEPDLKPESRSQQPKPILQQSLRPCPQAARTSPFHVYCQRVLISYVCCFAGCTSPKPQASDLRFDASEPFAVARLGPRPWRTMLPSTSIVPNGGNTNCAHRMSFCKERAPNRSSGSMIARILDLLKKQIGQGPCPAWDLKKYLVQSSVSPTGQEVSR